MNRDHIRAVEREDNSPENLTTADDGAPIDQSADSIDEEDDVEWIEEPQRGRATAWAIPSLFVLAILGWTGFFGWSFKDSIISGGTPEQWIDWIVAWAIPVLLILAIWLLTMRLSTREAGRFGDAARLLALESERLEERLLAINRELSLAREFLAEQNRDLDYLGRTATERLSTHADRLQELVRENGDQVDAIAGVSATALDNMEKLRGDLPVIANSARDVTNRIGSAGQTAQEQLEGLVAGFERLNTFGEASERQVTSLSERLDSLLGDMGERLDQIEGSAAARFAAIRDNSDSLRETLDTQEVTALAAIHSRADALKDELARIAELRNEDDEATFTVLSDRIAALRDEAAVTSQNVREAEQAALTAWSGQVEALSTRLLTIIEEVTQIDAQSLANSQAKLQALVEEAETVDRLIGERHQTFDDEVARRRTRIAESENEALNALAERMATFDDRLTEQRDGQIGHLTALSARAEDAEGRIDALGRLIASAAEQGEDTERSLAAAVERLSDRLADSRTSLDGTHEQIEELTVRAVRLLELIKASASHSEEDLPRSIEAFNATLADLESRTESLRGALADADRSGTELGETVSNAEHRSREATAALDSFSEGLSGTIEEQAAALDTLTEKLERIEAENARVAGQAREELTAAIAALRGEAIRALASIEENQADRILALADRIGEASAKAIDEAVEERTEAAIGSLDEASARATASSREAALELRDQLAKVNELVGNIESRVSQARARAEEQVDNDFSRRVALITESLNSNAIDIGKALSTEVTDTAWTSYLRGDRGIFTRRAVRLLDNTQAREIAELFDQDMDFREHVSRYIHDFEAMLRMLLSTRDGHALGVTVLSSDIGKLYVTLAQAIERLRE